MESPENLFKRWYAEPLDRLRQIPNGDGGFIALAVSCFLWERYAAAVGQQSERKTRKKDEELIGQLAHDFSVDPRTADVFWEVIRNGMLHQGMPKQKDREKPLPQWDFHHSYPNPFQLADVNGTQYLLVQPWKFMDKVVSLWQNNLELLERSRSFPWANIGDVPTVEDPSTR